MVDFTPHYSQSTLAKNSIDGQITICQTVTLRDPYVHYGCVISPGRTTDFSSWTVPFKIPGTCVSAGHFATVGDSAAFYKTWPEEK